MTTTPNIQPDRQPVKLHITKPSKQNIDMNEHEHERERRRFIINDLNID